MENAARTKGADTAAPHGAAPDDMRRLKALLFTPESARLDALETRLGSPQRLESATAEVIADALRRAEVSDHDNLSRAIAPVVVAVIRNEIRNSKDMMVEALYPITGRLVSAGISVAFAEMLATLNARLDALLSVNQVKWRWLSWRTGRPMAELALADARRATLQRLLYLQRGSGHLMAQWQADSGQDARADLLSGMIAALTNFASTALGHEGGDLRRLDLGDRLLYLRTSASHIVAAEFNGELKPDQERRLDDSFLDLLDAAGHAAQGDAAAYLEHVATAVAAVPTEPVATKRRVSPLTIIGVLLLAGLVWWGATWWRNNAKFSEINQSLVAFRADHPAISGWPLKLTSGPGARTATLAGLLPDGGSRAALQAALTKAAAPWKLQTHLGVGVAATQAGALARSQETDLQTLLTKLDRMEARNKAAEAGLQGKLAQLVAARTAATEAEARLQGKLAQLAAVETAATAQTSALQSQIDSPQARLAAALRGFAVFFDQKAEIIHPAGVAAELGKIVPLAVAAGGIRVIGYTDDSGSKALNQKISLERAQKVAQMLQDVGMPAGEIVAVGEAASSPVAPKVGEALNANRRVELRGLFKGELEK